MDYECVKNFEHLLPEGKVSIAENMHWPEHRPALVVLTVLLVLN
jgi:hypothetical protein